jgi:anti-anti-sigma factor
MSTTVRKPPPPPQAARRHPGLETGLSPHPGLETGVSLWADNRGRLVASLHLEGELCPASAPAFADELDVLLELGVLDVFIDLDDLRLCTSAGLEVFDRAHRRLGRDAGGVHLAGARGVVERVLAIVSGADPSFTVDVELDAA